MKLKFNAIKRGSVPSGVSGKSKRVLGKGHTCISSGGARDKRAVPFFSFLTSLTSLTSNYPYGVASLSLIPLCLPSPPHPVEQISSSPTVCQML